MPVLEVTQLRLKKTPANDPELLRSLSIVREKLQTKSQFYACTQDPTVLYILGIWPSLGSHLDFLASPARNEVLGPQEDMLEFQWTVHIDCDGMSSLPLDAPVLVIERLRVKENSVDAFDQAATRHAQLSRGSSLFKVAYGRCVDAAIREPEALIISGQDAQSHVTFASRQKRLGDDDHATINEQYEVLLIHQTQNLERTQAQPLNFT
jgi:hypothetical protein